MADCFSLENAAELVEQLRSNPNNVWAMKAADTIEALLAENAKLKEEFDRCYESNENLYNELQEVKAERDAAVADLKTTALNCHEDCVFSACFCCNFLATCNGQPSTGCTFVWRGVTDTNVGSKEEEDAETS